jgi:hypothetical protein
MHRAVSPPIGRELFLSLSRALAPFAFVGGLGALAFGAAACLQDVSTGTGTTDPTAAASTAASSANSVPSGAGCTTDSASQITLCEESSVCPMIDVDQSILPGCGFRLRPGAVIDLECMCADSLCPIGVADSCDQALQLLTSETSALGVCQEASNGHCVQVTASDAGTTTGTAATTTTPAATPSTCDKQCESECAGEPDCIQLCGC